MNDLVLKQKIRLGSFTYSDYTSFQEHQATSNKMDKNKMHHFLAVFYAISKWNARKDTICNSNEPHHDRSQKRLFFILF